MYKKIQKGQSQTMAKLLFTMILIILVVARFASPTEVTEETIEAGRNLYEKKCGFCHGNEGRGDGPVADYLNPRPRDFTMGLYKIRTTTTGEPPADEDLFRAITIGVPGTSMPAWNNLNEVQRWQLVHYIKTFSPDDFDPEFPPEMVTIGEKIPKTPATIAMGKELYKNMKCWECHGDEGKGDGPTSGTHKDDWGFPILPFNLAQNWKYKGGSSIKDIYTRFATGMNGTPMPSYADNLSEEERWQLAQYVSTLIREEKEASKVVLKSRFVTEELPINPEDSVWERAESIDIPLSGQVISRPRWQNSSIEVISVRSLFNDEQIAFLLEWDDRTRDDSPHEGENRFIPETADTYEKVNISEAPKAAFSDSVAIQFPSVIPRGPQKPFFLFGQTGKSVNIWRWKADRIKEPVAEISIEELNSQGYKKPMTSQPLESQITRGQVLWHKGTWKVVMKRLLKTEDHKLDVQFERGKLMAMAFLAWDGSNGETGLKMSHSSWFYLLPEASTPLSAYIYGLIAVVVAAWFEWWLIRRVRMSAIIKGER
jgi:DMSO reductase family type II enzyme heme b subunit